MSGYGYRVKGPFTDYSVRGKPIRNVTVSAHALGEHPGAPAETGRTGVLRDAGFVSLRSYPGHSAYLPPKIGSHGQQQLFRDNHSAPHVEVEGMFTTKRDRMTGMTMLGIAANASLEHFGRMPDPSADLSPYSSHVVRNLQNRGVVGKQFSSAVSNNSSYLPEIESMPGDSLPNTDLLPASQVASGKRLVRSVIGRVRSQQPAEQMEMF